MAKFLTGNELNSELGKLFEEAEERLILISPYIKLHVHYESILRAKKEKPELEIIVVFGKNEDNLAQSMGKEEINYFKEFPNIQIRYEKRLHAKYYANEVSAILSSMNLYKHSQDNNIEAGILIYSKLFGDNVDSEAFMYFERVIEQSELIYRAEPVFDKGIMGSGLKKKYLRSDISVDRLSEFYESKLIGDNYDRKKIESKKLNNDTGYCIRTGKPIPFNPKQPMCDEAYISWAKFGNKNFPEKYCHFSGEPSNGETSYAKPILKKNWNKANHKKN